MNAPTAPEPGTPSLVDVIEVAVATVAPHQLRAAAA